MSNFNYRAPADLFSSRTRIGRSPMGYRRFDTAAEAIRYAVEDMPSEFLNATVMEVDNERVDGARIRDLYDSKDYPLTKK